MAGLLCCANTAEIALSAATPKTCIQVSAPTNQRLKVLSWGVYADGISPSAEPFQIRLLRQTSAGTMTSLTPVLLGVGSEALQATALHTATAEPTAGNVLEVKECHPQSGYEKIYPLGQEILVPGAGRLGIECTAPGAVNVRCQIIYEE